MSVNIKLYQNLSDPLKVHKNKTLLKTCACEITESVDVDEMNVLLDMDVNMYKVNYAEIESFGRFYFATPGASNGNQMKIHLLSDPLSSFWNSASGSYCIAERSTSHQNPELVDDMLPFKSKPVLSIRAIGDSFSASTSGGCYIFTLGGK